ncbi:Eco57I restriction-modification methylase domain-containing protein [Hymenobacter defluvii]|uniref:site-specific DNA-methyltransferase (adenine-specific) n=1 Tax=Hymenobacter defluvii TaxID=2054411 RepID=A0ABS3TH38_9BACT|nr:hypothetical protein [Hymenobacter defluvii]MBO3272976.1 hypothetical protein [Hymenobacter defluvii]
MATYPALADALRAFATSPLTEAATKLFQELGYNTSRQLELPADSYAGFEQAFDATNPDFHFNPTKARVQEWTAVHLLFQLTAVEMQATGLLFEPTVDRADPDSYLFFAIDLSGNHYTKPQLADIVREVNKPFPMHVFVLFRYGGCLTLSLIQRRPNRRFMDRDVLETVTHVHGIRQQQPHTAHLRILHMFSQDAIRAELPGRRLQTFGDLQAGWRKVMRTDVLNQQFYREYSALSRRLIRRLHPSQVPSKLDAHQGVLNLLNRVMFVYFVQKKGWLMENENFLYHFWQAYREHRKTLPAAQADKLTFHEHWLNPVFFAAFNGKLYSPEGVKGLTHIPQSYQAALVNFPFLNGGLFARHDTYDQFLLPDEDFAAIFDYFESYLFTIQEDTPLDVSLEINPELLGKMYEGMINATDLDDVDAEHGIVYTERPEINFMVRRSLVEVLDQKLAAPTIYDRSFLYHFIFDKPDQQLELLRRQSRLVSGFDAQALRTAIATFTACDPSCGSGSMLLGVITVQMELLRTLDTYLGRPHTGTDDYDIKKQLISKCIYGVDIKEWAVRIAELRLWLYMITEADFPAEVLRKAPLLPNLDFKLRQGNSLLQKFGALDFTVADLMRSRKGNTGAKRKLREFIQAKNAFVTGADPDSRTTAKQLKAQELAVFDAFLNELIDANNKRIQQLGVQQRTQQGALFNTGRGQQAPLPLDAGEIAALRADTTQLRQLLTQLRLQSRLPFSYDIDFMEVFLAPDDEADRGFDLVIGNPPYVSQIAMLPSEDGQVLEKLLQHKERRAEANKQFKEDLSEKVYKTYPFLRATKLVASLDEEGQPVMKANGQPKTKSVSVYGAKVPGRSDLYSYFQLLCPSYLNNKGTFCFIIASAWLDVEYGAFVQQFLLKHTNLHGFYDCNVRSFDASINTIIYLHSAPINTAKLLSADSTALGDDGIRVDYRTLLPPNRLVPFIMNKIDFELAAYAPLLEDQEKRTTNTFHDHYRLIPITQKAIYEAGYDSETNTYSGDKWGGKYLRAPEIYYTMLNKAQAILTPLESLATVKRGFMTGANSFFYLPNSFFDITEEGEFYRLLPKYKDLPNNLKVEKEFTRDTLLSLKDVSNMSTAHRHLKIIYTKGRNVKGKKIKEYIEFGQTKFSFKGKEHGSFHERTSCASRANWYDLPEQDDFDLFYSILNGDRHLVFNLENQFAISDNLGGISFVDKKLAATNAVFFNSIPFRLFMEMTGREMTGSITGKKIQVFEFAVLPALLQEIPKAAKHLINMRPIGSIFTELGFDRTQPIRAQTPNPLPDRAALDGLIFDALGLSAPERQEVYWAVAELVQQRLNKAASR